MSSPNCCGCVSLIVSGLKQNAVDYNPYLIKRAIENTASQVDEPIGCGAGLIQVEKAFEYVLDYRDSLLQKLHFDVKYTVKSCSMRGIYLKNHDEVNETRDYLLTIEPKFFENKSRSHELNSGESTNEENENLLNCELIDDNERLFFKILLIIYKKLSGV
jgi:tripeptidyl-peptidase-2